MRWRFRHIFDALCTILIWPCDLDLRPFDLGGVWRIKIRQTYLLILSFLRLSIPELCVTQSDHIIITWNGHCACAVSRDLCIGGPPKPHVPIFWPQIVYSLYNFYGATMSIKGTYILEHPYVKAVFGRKKTVQSKSVPKMAVFRKFKGLNIKYSHWDPQKALPYPERRLLTFLRKNPFKGVGCSLIEELQKTKKKLVTPNTWQNHVFGEQKPLNRSLQILHAGCRPGRNHACQFLWRSVKGFWCGEGSNFGLFHWLASSPLKHSRTTVRVCDKINGLWIAVVGGSANTVLETLSQVLCSNHNT